MREIIGGMFVIGSPIWIVLLYNTYYIIAKARLVALGLGLVQLIQKVEGLNIILRLLVATPPV